MRKITEEATVAVLLPAATYTTATNGTGIDLAGEGRQLLVAVNSGEVNGTATVVIQEDDASNFSSATTLYAFNPVNTDTFAVAVDLLPTKRYVRARVSGVTGTSVVLSVTGVIYSERYRPSGVASL